MEPGSRRPRERRQLIVSHFCPQGMNLVSVPEPYGDARRLRDLLRITPELPVQTRHLRPQAAELEAWDRRLPSVAARASAPGALGGGESEPAPRSPRGNPRGASFAAGEPVTAVITDALLSKERPLEFAGLVGRVIPALAPLSADILRGAARGSSGRWFPLPSPVASYPRVSARTLWRIWRDAIVGQASSEGHRRLQPDPSRRQPRGRLLR